MKQWRALDLFCGAGGATKGLQRAGFHVTGVDIAAQPHYCGDEFYQSDALAFPLFGFDFIWASPVCKGWTKAKSIHGHKDRYPMDQISEVRDLVKLAGVPYAIENVVGAPLSNPFMLCGLMFGLRVLRHRHFESNFLVSKLTHPRHFCVAGHNFLMNEAREAMGIDWMIQKELSQAIPPAYAEFIGLQAMQFMERAA